jgi:Fe-S oxidoreductase
LRELRRLRDEMLLEQIVYSLAFFITLILFILRIKYLYSILRLGKGEIFERLDNPAKRIKTLVSHLILQSRHRDEKLGIAHALIFWGFLIYLLSYINDPFVKGFSQHSIFDISLATKFAGIIVLIGLALAIYRRVVVKPPHLENTWDAWLTLALIGLVVLLSYFSNEAYTLAWWLHTLLLFAFLIFVVYSKHLHIITSPFSVLTRDFSKGFERVELQEGERYGAEKIQEFHWRELLNAFACANCGRCDRVCPALNSNSKLSPRKMIFKGLREFAFEQGREALAGKESRSIFEYIAAEDVWDCMLCLACVAKCPVYNEHHRLLIQLRRRLVEHGIIDEGMKEVMLSYRRYGNTFRKPSRQRAAWVKGVGFPIKDVRKEFAEYLWYVGDYAAYHPALAKITKISAKVFKGLEIDFGLLYEAELNVGNDLRRMGEEGLYEMLVEKNLATLSKAKFDKILTTDPHAFHTLKNEYLHYGGSYEVYHYTQLLSSLLKNFEVELGYVVTYHDPCHLGRYNGIYDAPRKILSKLGIKLVEMERIKEHAFCCGAGGGGIWKKDKKEGKRPAEIRVEEAAELADVLVVSCPKDYIMFLDAIKSTGLEEKLKVVDLVELVAEGLNLI